MTTSQILSTLRKSRRDSQSSVAEITGYSRQHIAACERGTKCFTDYPSIVQYVLTVIQQNINAEDATREWLTEANDTEEKLRKEVSELATAILRLTS